MSSKAIQAVAVILGVIAIILIVFVWRLSRNFAENAQNAQAPAATQAQAQPAVPQYEVVVATTPLPANVAITKDDVVLAQVTVQPTEYFANVEDVIGRKPLVDLDKGQPVTPRFFKDSNIIARGIPAGHRALSLKVDDVVGVGGFIRPGDIVDVLVYIKSTTGTPTGTKQDQTEDIATQARVLLKDVLVLAYEDHLVEPPKGVEDKKKDPAQQQQRHERTAIVAVPEPQVTRVLLGASLGEVRLALHGSQPTDAQLAAAPADAGAAATAAPGDAGISKLSPADEAKAKEKAKLMPPDQVITAVQLSKVTPVPPPGVKAPPPPPRIEVYRGSKVEQVRP